MLDVVSVPRADMADRTFAAAAFDFVAQSAEECCSRVGDSDSLNESYSEREPTNPM